MGVYLGFSPFRYGHFGLGFGLQLVILKYLVLLHPLHQFLHVGNGF